VHVEPDVLAEPLEQLLHACVVKCIDPIDETKRWAVWEKCDECVGLGCHAS